MNLEVDRLAEALEKVRKERPVVHAITNWVTSADVAAVLNAINARPVMAAASEEVEEIVSKADSLMLNLGTPTPGRVETMLVAGCHANEASIPVIFDPIGAGASKFRRESVARFLRELKISVIRGNSAEIGLIAGMGGELRGVEAASGPKDLAAAARALSEQTGAVIVASGARDLIVGGNQAIAVDSGHPLMGLVTGTGCMLAAVIAAFAASENDRMIATLAAVTCFGLAGELAGERAKGPGSFKALLLDALYVLERADLKEKAKGRIIEL